MDEEENPPLLSLEYRGSEYTPDFKTRYLAFTARVSNEGFSGEAEFETTDHHIEYFVQQLATFYESLTPEPEFIAGLAPDGNFALRLSLADRLGHVGLDCEVQESYPTGTHRNRVQVYRIIELMQVHKLLRFFRWVLTDPDPDSVFIR